METNSCHRQKPTQKDSHDVLLNTTHTRNYKLGKKEKTNVSCTAPRAKWMSDVGAASGRINDTSLRGRVSIDHDP